MKTASTNTGGYSFFARLFLIVIIKMLYMSLMGDPEWDYYTVNFLYLARKIIPLNQNIKKEIYKVEMMQMGF